MRSSRIAFWLCCFLSCTAMGCEPDVDAELLRVDALSHDHVEAGVEVSVEGSGFPAGRDARVVLLGEVRRPGAHPHAVRVGSDARAVAPERLSWIVTEELLVELGGRGTFAGDLRVELPAADGHGRVSGVMRDIELDFAVAASRRLGLELDQQRRGSDLLARIGIQPTRDDGAAGIGVDAVQPASVAATSGVAKGDRIVAIDGVRIRSAADFLPAPGADTVVLELSRPGEPSGLRVPVTLPEASGATAPAHYHLGAAVAGLLVLLLFFVAPSARLTGYLAAALASSRSKGARLPALSRVWRRRSVRGWIVHACWTFVTGLAVLVAFGVLPLTARIYTGGVDVGVLVLVAFGAQLASLVEPATGWLARARAFGSALARACLDAAPALLAVACVVVSSGTLRLTGIVAAQGGEPWDWYVFRNPATFLAFVAWLGAVSATPGVVTDEGTFRVVARRVHVFVSSGLGVALFLGGFRIPGLSGDPLVAEPVIRLVAAAVFVGKAALLMFVLHRLGRRARRSAMPGRWWRWTLPLAGVAAGAAVGALVVGIPVAPVERVAGPVLCVVALLVGAVVIARAVTPRERRGTAAAGWSGSRRAS